MKRRDTLSIYATKVTALQRMPADAACFALWARMTAMHASVVQQRNQQIQGTHVSTCCPKWRTAAAIALPVCQQLAASDT